MRLLLDTHIFVWYDSGDLALKASFRAAIDDPANEIYLSIASIWEIVAKHRLGQFKLPGSPAEHLIKVRNQFGFVNLVVDDGSIIELAKLPLIHRDPFDRIIVAQAIQHGITLVTDDPQIRQYPVNLL
jgi:PIN domain nuclease of toxin-antitoxin system